MPGLTGFDQSMSQPDSLGVSLWAARRAFGHGTEAGHRNRLELSVRPMVMAQLARADEMSRGVGDGTPVDIAGAKRRPAPTHFRRPGLVCGKCGKAARLCLLALTTRGVGKEAEF